MGRMKDYNLAHYSSIYSAIGHILEHYLIQDDGWPCYDPKGLEEVLNLLCINDVQHEYTRTEASKYNLVSLTWQENGKSRHYNWHEKVEYYLLSYQDNWADEMDVEGFVILDTQQMIEWNETMVKVKELLKNTTYDFWIGTNEGIEYDSFDEFIRCFSRRKISAEVASTLKGTLGMEDGRYGIIPTLDDINNWIEDRELDALEDE